VAQYLVAIPNVPQMDGLLEVAALSQHHLQAKAVLASSRALKAALRVQQDQTVTALAAVLPLATAALVATLHPTQMLLLGLLGLRTLVAVAEAEALL
jgi:hypothetical protein